MFNIINFINKFKTKYIDVGSFGKNFLFVENLDKMRGFKLDENLTLPYKDNSIFGVYCSHVIEHLNDETISRLINECNRVLKKNGIFRVVTINFKLLHNLLANDEVENIISLSSFRGRPEWNNFGLKFSEVSFVTHFFANYQNVKYEESPEFGFKHRNFYRGPPIIEEEDVRDKAKNLPVEKFGKWLVSQIPKEHIMNGGHINPLTLDTLNKLSNSLEFKEKKFCQTQIYRLRKMEKFYNKKREKISIFFEAYKK